ncbi:MAG: hypothetical protein O2954_07705 [bacterium]|nr:hypothetical protein [bacterium]
MPEIGFDPEPYRERMAVSAQRLMKAKSLEEPDCVPVTISTAGSFYCHMFGYNIREYYVDLEMQLEVQLRGLRWAFEELGDDRTSCGINVDLGPVAEGIFFELPIERPDGTSPWVPHAFSGPEAIESLEIPDPEDHPGVQRVYRLYEEQKARVKKMGLNLSVGGGLQIHPPLSAACAIMPLEAVYVAMQEEPELIRKVFDKLLTAWFKLQEYRDKYFGRETRNIGLADDNSAFVSDPMYRDLVMPYNMQIYERYGKEGRYLHADGPNDHHFRTYAQLMKLTSMDMGGFSNIANAKRELGGQMFFSGGLNCKDVYGDFECARPVVERAIGIGAPGGGYALAVGGETYAGVNPDTLVQVVAYARQAGRYPIDPDLVSKYRHETSDAVM